MCKNKKGLYGKYLLEKANGKPLDDDAMYFVLRYDKDPAALEALKTYAEKTENTLLKAELNARIWDIENPNGFFGVINDYTR